MGEWGLLATPPETPGWEFGPEEYRRRVAALRAGMARAGVDALFLTSEKNIRYVSGFHSQTWVSPTRSRFVILPREGAPVVVAPTTNIPGFRSTSWIEDLRGWPAPRPADDGVSLLVDALGTLASPVGGSRTELGPGEPAGDARRRLCRVRGRAGRTEVRRRRPGAAAGPHGQERARAGPGPPGGRDRQPGLRPAGAFLALGQSEREIYALHHRLLVELGADKVPYLVPVSGPTATSRSTWGRPTAGWARATS